MPRILCELALPTPVRHHLQQLVPGEWHFIEQHASSWTLGQEWFPGPEILLCKRPPDNLDPLTALRLIQFGTVGYEHLRDLGFADRAIRVCNARGMFDTAIAEWNVAMMIALQRDLYGMFRNQEKSLWHREDRYGQEIRGRVVGLWGYGGIGRETARLARTLGMQVWVLTRRGVGPRREAYTIADTGDPEGVLPHRTFTPEQKDEFLAGLDFLILALPHTQHSGGMIGPAELRALPERAFLLNPSRGPIVQEAALLEALSQGWIRGAALDTHYAYPLPAAHPLWRMPNVILTPHISGIDRSEWFAERMADLFAQNALRYLNGQPLLNELTRREWLEA